MKRKSTPRVPVPPEYRSDLCVSCPVGCEQPFRPDGCPYVFFEEDEIILSRLIQQSFDDWKKKNGFSQYDEP